MTGSALLTTELLLAALQPQQTAEQWLETFKQSNIDANDLAVRAIVFGLAPLLHHKITQWNITLPPRAAAKLAVTHTATAQRNAAIYMQMDELAVALTPHNIRPIALKGIHLATSYYAEPALRPMNDIDLLFTADEMDTVHDVLTNLGYSGKHKSADMGPGVVKHTSTYKRNEVESNTPNPYLSTGGDRMIEPHTSLEESWFGLKVDITPGMRESAHETTLGNNSWRVLDAENLLLHLCVHFCFHLIQGAPSLVQFSDLAIVTSGGGLDWDRLVQRSAETEAAPYTWAALTLAHKILNAPIPIDTLNILEDATSPSLRSYINDWTLANILNRTQQAPLTNVAQRVKRGMQDRAETARWANNWRGRLNVWRTALDVSKTDTGQLILKGSKT